MKHTLTQELIKNGKLEATASTLTTAAGISTLLGFMPIALGAVATLSGITLTWVLICKSRLEIKKIQISIETDKIKKRKESHYIVLDEKQ